MYEKQKVIEGFDQQLCHPIRRGVAVMKGRAAVPVCWNKGEPNKLQVLKKVILLISVIFIFTFITLSCVHSLVCMMTKLVVGHRKGHFIECLKKNEIKWFYLRV